MSSQELFNQVPLTGKYKEAFESFILENKVKDTSSLSQTLGLVQLIVALETVPLTHQVNTLEKEKERLERLLLEERAKSNSLEEKTYDLEKENFRLQGIIDTLKDIQIYGDRVSSITVDKASTLEVHVPKFISNREYRKEF